MTNIMDPTGPGGSEPPQPTLEEVEAELARMIAWRKTQFLTLPESEAGQYIDALQRAVVRLKAEREAAKPAEPPTGDTAAAEPPTGEYGPIRARRIIREWEERNKREGEPGPPADGCPPIVFVVTVSADAFGPVAEALEKLSREFPLQITDVHSG